MRNFFTKKPQISDDTTNKFYQTLEEEILSVPQKTGERDTSQLIL